MMLEWKKLYLEEVVDFLPPQCLEIVVFRYFIREKMGTLVYGSSYNRSSFSPGNFRQGKRPGYFGSKGFNRM